MRCRGNGEIAVGDNDGVVRNGAVIWDPESCAAWVRKRCALDIEVLEMVLTVYDLYLAVSGVLPLPLMEAILGAEFDVVALRDEYRDCLPHEVGKISWAQEAVFMIRHGIPREICHEVCAHIEGYMAAIGAGGEIGVDERYRAWARAWNGEL